MAKKRREFRPDPKGPGLLSRMYVTPSQRLKLLKWFLFSLVAVLVMVLQDVIFSRMDIFGATTDLLPAVVMLVCVLQGVESGGTFALVISTVYYLSGSAPSAGAIIVMTVLGMGVTMFRESFLQKGFSSSMLCAAVAMLAYELVIFFLGLATGLTLFGRIGVFVLTAVITILVMPVLYPLLKVIGKIGGETWKE